MKRVLWKVARYSGFIKVWMWLRPRSVTILMLHGVANTRQSNDWEPSWDRISPAWLDHCLKLFSRTHQFVSLSEAVDMLSSGRKLKRNTIVLTFDDGYRNNLTTAWPILKEYSVKPCFYVVSSHVTDRTVYWIDRLDFALQQVDLKGREFEVNGQVFRANSNERKEIRRLHFRLRRAIKEAFNDEQMNRWLDTVCGQLEKESGKSLSDHMENDTYAALLDWKELQTAKLNGIEIGSHTTKHYRLTEVEQAVAMQSVVDSKALIEKELNVECRHFCYPNGNVDSSVAQMVKEAGYVSGVSCDNGVNFPGADLWRLKRLSLPTEGADDGELIAFISGFKQFVSSCVSK